jgi:hypothetical protein
VWILRRAFRVTIVVFAVISRYRHVDITGVKKLKNEVFVLGHVIHHGLIAADFSAQPICPIFKKPLNMVCR